LFSKYTKNQILYQKKTPVKKGCFGIVYGVYTRIQQTIQSPSWHSSSVSSSVEVDSEVTIAETSADTPLVAGATAFNFPLVFTATSAIKLTFTAFNAVGM
jgi:hypothetical protein